MVFLFLGLVVFACSEVISFWDEQDDSFTTCGSVTEKIAHVECDGSCESSCEEESPCGIICTGCGSVEMWDDDSCDTFLRFGPLNIATECTELYEDVVYGICEVDDMDADGDDDMDDDDGDDDDGDEDEDEDEDGYVFVEVWDIEDEDYETCGSDTEKHMLLDCDGSCESSCGSDDPCGVICSGCEDIEIWETDDCDTELMLESTSIGDCTEVFLGGVAYLTCTDNRESEGNTGTGISASDAWFLIISLFF